MKSERISLRITKELKEALEKRAKEESRTFSNYIETALKRDIFLEPHKKCINDINNECLDECNGICYKED